MALLLRFGFVLVQNSADLFEATFVAGDSALYLALARSILSGHGMSLNGSPTAFVGPLYPLFLATMFGLHLDVTAIELFQCVIGASTAVLAGLIARSLAIGVSLGRTRTLVVMGLAAMGTAVYPHLIFWTGYVLTETLFVALVALAVFISIEAVRSNRASYLVISGFIFGLAALTRAPALALAGSVGLWIVVAYRSQPLGARLLRTALLVVGLAMPLIGWGYRNWVTLGSPIITSTESGLVLYQGNSPSATGGSRGYVDTNDFTPLQFLPTVSELERDRLYFNAAVSEITTHPIATVARWPAKVWNMWRPTYEGASVRNGAITLATYLPLVGLGLWGVVWLILRRSFVATIPALILVTWFAVHVLVTGMIRFRLPAEFLFLVTAPFAMVAAVSTARAMWRRRAAASA